MPAHPVVPLRRTAYWVLAAWLCVLLAGVWAPMAGAQASQAHAVHLCSGELAPQDAPSPLSASMAETALHHAVDCPLCLPAMAPPSWPVVLATLGVEGGQSVGKAQQGVSQPQSMLPPARGPPPQR